MCVGGGGGGGLQLVFKGMRYLIEGIWCIFQWMSEFASNVHMPPTRLFNCSSQALISLPPVLPPCIETTSASSCYYMSKPLTVMHMILKYCVMQIFIPGITFSTHFLLHTCSTSCSALMVVLNVPLEWNGGME